jgi:hypothetical protein
MTSVARHAAMSLQLLGGFRIAWFMVGRLWANEEALSLVISFTSYAADKWSVTIGIYTDANGYDCSSSPRLRAR